MSDSPLVYSREGDVAVLTLDRPKERNTINEAMTDALVEACERVNNDISVRCAILTASGDIFCAGGNLKAMYHREHHFAGSAAQIQRYYAGGVQRIAKALYFSEVPFIAAVNGPAIGAGLDIALMCDIRIAAQQAIFAESFIRLGLVSAAGGSWFLQRAVGQAMAAELTLTGDNFDAQAALRAGVISRITTREALMAKAHEIAARIARHPSHSIRLNKRVLRESANRDLLSSLDLAAGLQAIVQHTDDYREAIEAAVEKRQPHYKNR